MTEPDTADFAGLLARAAAGDVAAQGELVRQYEPKVRMVARVLLGPALRPYLESSDLTQSVHKSIIVGLAEQKFDISGPDQLIGLALTVLRRKAGKHWRHLKRQQRLSGDQATRGTGDLANVLTSLSSRGDDPVSEASFRDQLRRVCDELDTTERHVIDLRLEGYMLAEIADQIGVSRVALRVRMTRLRQRLQAAGVVTDWF